MKKVFLISLISLISLSSYAKTWTYRCRSGALVYFTTADNVTSKRAQAMGETYCGTTHPNDFRPSTSTSLRPHRPRP